MEWYSYTDKFSFVVGDKRDCLKLITEAVELQVYLKV